MEKFWYYAAPALLLEWIYPTPVLWETGKCHSQDRGFCREGYAENKKKSIIHLSLRIFFLPQDRNDTCNQIEQVACRQDP